MSETGEKKKLQKIQFFYFKSSIQTHTLDHIPRNNRKRGKACISALRWVYCRRLANLRGRGFLARNFCDTNFGYRFDADQTDLRENRILTSTESASAAAPSLYSLNGYSPADLPIPTIPAPV